MIKVIPFIYVDLDDLYANTYVLIDEKNECVVVDPAKPDQGIVKYIQKNDLTLKGILLTHGHIDHIRGVDAIFHVFHCPVYIGFEDQDKLNDEFSNCSMLFGDSFIISAPSITVADKEALKLLEEDIHVVETPYHTSGSVCYYLKESQLLFTGDFLFKGGIGRCDLPTAMPKEFDNSLRKILALPKETKVYPGHGKSTTLEEECRANPFVK